VLQAHLLQIVRSYASKDVRFGIECREAVLAGVNKLADAVQVTLGPKVRLVHLQAVRPKHLPCLLTCCCVAVVCRAGTS
jgi:hypothetical protein